MFPLMKTSQGRHGGVRSGISPGTTRTPPTMLCSMAALAALCLGSAAMAQPVFSIDFQGPPIGVGDFFMGVPMSEGDLLIPAPGMAMPGPLPVPGIIVLPGLNPVMAPHLGLGSYVFGAPRMPGIPNRVELDALSYGNDTLITPTPDILWTFSVDEFAAGLPTGLPIDVRTEGVFGNAEASADVYRTFPPGLLLPGPLPPFATPPSCTLMIDGNGMPPPLPPPLPPVPGLLGLGLMEPNPPTPFLLPDPGSNVDALEVDTRGPATVYPIYFSLDAAFGDPMEPAGIVNTGSAAANGFRPGDILVCRGPLMPTVVFAPVPMLGLDLVAGPGSDDLDALALFENGTGVFEPSMIPFQWVGGATDMVFFSVRRGSAVIGMPDSAFGIPIEPGDILVPPLAAGMSPFPAIWIAAENLGLATFRSTPGMLFMPP